MYGDGTLKIIWSIKHVAICDVRKFICGREVGARPAVLTRRASAFIDIESTVTSLLTVAFIRVQAAVLVCTHAISPASAAGTSVRVDRNVVRFWLRLRL